MNSSLLSLEDALEKILAAARPLPPQNVPVTEAFGLGVAELVHAAIDLPPFDNSSVDGFAVRASDLAAASAEQPVALGVIDTLPAGSGAATSLEPGTCARVFTGSMLPPGADAVVMQEDVRIESSQPDRVFFAEAAPPGANIRFRGEDVKQLTPLARVGWALTAPQVGLLAAAGLGSVRVHPRPTLALIATGDELREPGQRLLPGQIYESNRVSLAALAQRWGASSKSYPLVPDDLAATKAVLEKAFAECDAVVTTGGVSVGEMDFVKAAFGELGGQIDFWKVAIKPGKPFAFGQLKGKLLFGLPGNPVSAFVTFFLLVCPAVMLMRGAKNFATPKRSGTLAEALVNDSDRRHFMRVRLEKSEVRLAGLQASHRLASLALANGLVDVPPNTTLPAGTTVGVLCW